MTDVPAQMPASRGPVPVVLLTGFLGAGKTTLLNRLLRDSRGTRVGVVVNDFGDIEIDAMTVAGQVGSMVSLGGGCLCCAADVGELEGYLDTLTRPDLRIDVIVVEASGLAEPQELVRMLLAAGTPRAAYGGLVEVVDAVHFPATRRRHPEILRHLGIADLVVVNKADLTGEAEREAVLAAVREAAPGTPVVTAAGRIDPELLFERREAAETVGQLSFEDVLAEAEEEGGHGEGGHDHAGHLHAAYDAVSYVRDEPLDPRRLMRFLDGRPEGLYRIKGYVGFGGADPAHRYALHAVGRYLRFRPEPHPEDARRTQLVLIGSGVDADTLVRDLDECRAGPGEVYDESALWGVLRFVPRAREEAPDGREPDTSGGPGDPVEPGGSVEPEPVDAGGPGATHGL